VPAQSLGLRISGNAHAGFAASMPAAKTGIVMRLKTKDLRPVTLVLRDIRDRLDNIITLPKINMERVAKSPQFSGLTDQYSGILSTHASAQLSKPDLSMVLGYPLVHVLYGNMLLTSCN
jgi:hypothetical protein